MDLFFETYPDVAKFLADARKAVYKPGYLINAWGRWRRFYQTTDQSIMAAQEREAGNFLIQSLVADTLSKASYNLWFERYARLLNDEYVPEYRILLGIHDALLIECKPQDVELMTKVIIPKCMCDMCIVPGINLRFDVDISIHLRWGEKMSPEDKERVFGPLKS